MSVFKPVTTRTGQMRDSMHATTPFLAKYVVQCMCIPDPKQVTLELRSLPFIPDPKQVTLELRSLPLILLVIPTHYDPTRAVPLNCARTRIGTSTRTLDPISAPAHNPTVLHIPSPQCIWRRDGCERVPATRIDKGL